MTGASVAIVIAVALGQSGTALRALAEQVFERAAAAGGRAAVTQLERAGGKAAVEAALREAEREGGEALARKAAGVLSEAGAPALALIAKSPARAIAALDGLSGETLVRGVAAIERQPSMLALPNELSRRAVAAEVRLPGVGASIVESLGDDGARIAGELSESQGVSLARWSKDVAELPAKERSGVIALLERKPGVILDYLDRHPGVLVAGTVTAGAAIVEMTALVTGQPGPVSEAVRGTMTMADSALSTPLAITVTVAGLVAVALGVFYVLPTVLRRWRAKRAL